MTNQEFRKRLESLPTYPPAAHVATLLAYQEYLPALEPGQTPLAHRLDVKQTMLQLLNGHRKLMKYPEFAENSRFLEELVEIYLKVEQLP